MFFSLTIYLDWNHQMDIFLINICMSLVSIYSLEEMMEIPLPTITEQKRLVYRPSKNEARHVYELLNCNVFNNELKMPNIYLAARCRKYWGMCMGETTMFRTGSYCEIQLMDKWFCPQWFVTTLAHEMCHQHQWDIDGPLRNDNGQDCLMSHGPTFFRFRDKLAEVGISLKRHHRMRKWFLHQNFFKC